MPTLDWIGKNAVIRHHKEVPFRLLEPDVELSHGGAETGNLIVQGDNLHALKALLPKYAGKVKCIYIDPPYNTGNEGWVYNDKVNSPEINRWLGSVVGKEAEDLSRHDKWLCMMYPRMVLLKQFLSEDGAIFVSIDDNEVASLRLLMDEIFGKQSFIKQISWQKVYTVKNSATQFSEMHDHILVYATDGKKWSPHLLGRTSKQDDAYSNPDGDSRGPWKATPVHARNKYDDGRYEIVSPAGAVLKPPTGTYWRFSEENFKRLDREKRIWWGENGTNIPAQKTFLTEVKDGVVASTMWFHRDAGHNAEAKNELREVLGELPDELMTPKPIRLIRRIIQLATDHDSIVLDSFAGSGTTGHAVLEQNSIDGGTRKFVMVECIEEIASNIIAKRLKNACDGYSFSGKTKDRLLEKTINWKEFSDDLKRQRILDEVDEIIESRTEDFTSLKIGIENGTLTVNGEKIVSLKKDGLGGGFQFCRLSEEPLFNEFGDIRDDVTFAQLADFVWFAETGTGYMEKGIASPFFKTGKATSGASAKGMQSPSPYSPLLGTHGGVAVYLLFNGILGDRRPAGGNILTPEILASLPKHDGLRVIYAAAVKGIGPAALARANIVFKQTPYAIEV